MCVHACVRGCMCACMRVCVCELSHEKGSREEEVAGNGCVMREKGGKAEGGRNKGREEGDEWGRVMSGGR